MVFPLLSARMNNTARCFDSGRKIPILSALIPTRYDIQGIDDMVPENFNNSRVMQEAGSIQGDGQPGFLHRRFPGIFRPGQIFLDMTSSHQHER